MLKPIQKIISQITGVSLWPPSSPDHNPLDYAIESVLENKMGQLAIQILICLRLLLRGNGIKCPKKFILKVCKSF